MTVDRADLVVFVTDYGVVEAGPIIGAAADRVFATMRAHNYRTKAHKVAKAEKLALEAQVEALARSAWESGQALYRTP